MTHPVDSVRSLKLSDGDVARPIERYQEFLGRALAKAEEAQVKGLDADEVLARASEATLKPQEDYKKI